MSTAFDVQIRKMEIAWEIAKDQVSGQVKQDYLSEVCEALKEAATAVDVAFPGTTRITSSKRAKSSRSPKT